MKTISDSTGPFRTYTRILASKLVGIVPILNFKGPFPICCPVRYFVAGNHDWYGNVTGELVYTTLDPTGRWYTLFFLLIPNHKPLRTPRYFPSLNYDVVMDVGNNVTAHLIFFDTYRMTFFFIHQSSHCCLPQKFSLDMTSEAHVGFINTSWADETVAWLNATLANSTSQWKLLFTHYPYLSAGSHGYNRVQYLSKTIL